MVKNDGEGGGWKGAGPRAPPRIGKKHTRVGGVSLTTDKDTHTHLRDARPAQPRARELGGYSPLARGAARVRTDDRCSPPGAGGAHIVPSSTPSKPKNSPPHDLAAVVHGDAHACDERQRGARRRVRRRTSERASGRFFFLPRRPPTRHSPIKNKSSAAATTLPLRQLTVVDVVQQLAAPGDRHGGERERGAGACLALLLRLLLLNLSSRALAGCCSLALFTRGRARERGGRGEEACGREGCSRSVGLSLSARSGVCAVRAASRKGRDE